MSATEYYNHTTYPSTGAAGSSSAMRAELDLIEAGFGKLPDLSGNGSKIVAVNSGGTAIEAITTTGTGNGVRATSPTFTTPNIGAATATTVNGMTLTSSTGTFTLTNGKTFSVSNTLTLAGTDGSTLNVGTGGTLGTAAYTASSAYLSSSSTVTVAQGGTGATTFTDAGVLIGNGSGAIQATSAGTAGQVLTSNGTGVDPTFQASPVGWTLLSTVTASNSATADIETTFDGTYDKYAIVVSGLTSQNDGAGLRCRMKISGSYDTAANYKYHTENSTAAAATYAAQVNTGLDYINIILDQGNAAAESSDLIIWVGSPASTAFSKTIHYHGVALDSAGNPVKICGSGLNTGTGALTGIRLYFSAGNLVAGKFRLYGIKNS